jgi:hypothetical protein
MMMMMSNKTKYNIRNEGEELYENELLWIKVCKKIKYDRREIGKEVEVTRIAGQF